METAMIYGRHPVLETLGPKVDKLYIQKGAKDGSIGKIRRVAKELGIFVQEREKSRLDEMTAGANHQGVVCFVSDFRYAEIDEMLALAEARGEDPLLVLLDSVHDPHNLGAVIRSALAMGAHGVIIPKHRAASVNATVYKTSAGAVDEMLVAKVTNLNRTIEDLKQKNIWVYGADAGQAPLYTADLTGPIAIVVGNEGDGIAEKTKEHTDVLLSIPMPGGFESLNASVAASIFLYETLRQRDGKQKKV
ncbi:Putative TrmH family tRNA/rRNA methyltransferase [Aedoeadaptatus ivorii]|uniref:TrmH family tRNA/rRNA methyltransferase n=1 Tax=Aedoeadaptatus ivorii TaxID=54006 RepID=A0A3S4Y874_9FIRM|nr:23S rRNA (guanosine(2251)-2'-O)-methyltransferase RlmB [Peptoniphilus ivorii]VEJ36275.1 Putative TrmH family tRNA/rRNA methyltransferase [Peptoniphilus ivorii]